MSNTHFTHSSILSLFLSLSPSKTQTNSRKASTSSWSKTNLRLRLVFSSAWRVTVNTQQKAQKAEISWTRRHEPCVCARARVYMAFCLSFNPGDLVIFSFLPSRALLSLPYLLSSLNFFFSLSNCVKSDSMSLSLSVAFYEFRFICTKRKRKKKRSKWIFERSLTWIVFEGQTAGHPGGSRRTVHLVLCAKKFIRFVDNETKGEENHNSKNRR